MAYVLVAIGSAFGGAARYWFYGITARAGGAVFPWGTLLVNLLGCTFIGFFATITGPDGRLLVRPGTRQFVMAGFCGGFTTFSTFSLETLSLARDGEWGPALANVLGSVLLCLVGVWIGYAIASVVNEG